MAWTRSRDIGDDIAEAAGRPRVARATPCKNCGPSELWAESARPLAEVFDLDFRTATKPMVSPEDGEKLNMLGRVFDLGGLNAVAAAQPAEYMTRATNMAGVCILGLQALDTKLRTQALTEIGGAEWAQGVTDLAATVGLQNLEDRIRFALALNFLIGIIHFEAKVESIYSLAYAKTKYTYDRLIPAPLTNEQAAPYIARALPEDKAREWAGKVGYVGKDALDGLDAMALEYVVSGSVQQTGLGGLDGLDGFFDFVGDVLGTIGSAIVSAGKTIVGAVVSAVKFVGGVLVDALGAIFNFTGDIVCAGLKWLLGDTVGGIICSIFSTFATILKYTLTSLLEVAKAVAKGIVNCIKALIAGNVKAAGMALLTEVTAVVFLLPPLGPMLAVLLGVSMEEIRNMGERVSKRAPLFLIHVITSAFGMVALTPAAVAQFIDSLRPAVEVFAGAAVFASAGGKATLVDCENAVGSIMSHCTAIILRVIDFGVTVSKIASATDMEDNAAIKKMIEKILKAMVKLNFKDIVDAITAFGLTPGLIGKRLAASSDGPGSLKQQLAKAAIRDQLDILNAQLATMDPHALAPIMYAGTSRMNAADDELLFYATLRNLPPEGQLELLSRLAGRGVVLPVEKEDGSYGFPDAPGLPSASIANFGLWPFALGGAGLLGIGALLLTRKG